MLNTNIRLGSNSQTVSFNQPSTGILQRSHPKSVFVRFQKGSDMEDYVFPRNGSKPYIHQYQFSSNKYENYKETHGRIEVVVLQILIFGQDHFLVEVVEEKFLNETL